MTTLREGEIEVTLEKAAGLCVICRKRLEVGPAVQMSKHTERKRHVDCLPKTDKRFANFDTKSSRKKAVE